MYKQHTAKHTNFTGSHRIPGDLHTQKAAAAAANNINKRTHTHSLTQTKHKQLTPYKRIYTDKVGNGMLRVSFRTND